MPLLTLDSGAALSLFGGEMTRPRRGRQRSARVPVGLCGVPAACCEAFKWTRWQGPLRSTRRKRSVIPRRARGFFGVASFLGRALCEICQTHFFPPCPLFVHDELFCNSVTFCLWSVFFLQHFKCPWLFSTSIYQYTRLHLDPATKFYCFCFRPCDMNNTRRFLLTETFHVFSCIF